VADDFDENTEANRKLRFQYDIRILPIGAFTYLLCYLDRSNIGWYTLIYLSTKHSNLSQEMQRS
jgi:hypothetical protein